MSAEEQHDQGLALDFAWRTHDAIQQWTRNVDQKSSIVLAFITAIGALLANETLRETGALAQTDGARLWLVRVATGSFFAAGCSALGAIIPRLRANRVRREARRGLIFFGHLRYRESVDELASAYSGLTPTEVLEQLAHQNKKTSEIAWTKHRLLQLAIVLLGIGVIAFAVARLG